MKPKMILTAAAVIFFLGASYVKFVKAPEVSERFPRGWIWYSEMIFEIGYADEKGNFPQKNQTSKYIRKIYVKDETNRPNSIILKDEYTIINPLTGAIEWQYFYSASVDPATGKHLKKEFKNDYYVFPREVQKQNYSLRTNYLKGIPVSFSKVEEIEGLETYLFTYSGRGEYTESYAGTADFPGYSAAPGQEIKCKDDQFKIRIWVEPVTGEIVKLDESCFAGDYVYDIATGKPITPLARWGGISEGKSLMEKVEQVSDLKFKILLTSTYLPLGLTSVGVIFLLFGFFRKSKKEGSAI